MSASQCLPSSAAFPFAYSRRNLDQVSRNSNALFTVDAVVPSGWFFIFFQNSISAIVDARLRGVGRARTKKVLSDGRVFPTQKAVKLVTFAYFLCNRDKNATYNHLTADNKSGLH